MTIRRHLVHFVSLSLLMLLACPARPHDARRADTAGKAAELAAKFIIVDTHLDVPYRMQEEGVDIASRSTQGDFDYFRARSGRLDVPFFAIYIPPSREKDGTARSLAIELIDAVEGVVRANPDKFALARSVGDVRRNFSKDTVSIVLCMENGAPLEGNLENLRFFYDRGIRYITLAHSESNHIADSSYDKNRRWKGLSPFGRELIPEMNRLGMMIDVTHVTDDAFYQILEMTRSPVIASHSSCRRFTPDWERNMSDDMIRALARNGGVIQINFGSSFISERYRRATERRRRAFRKLREKEKVTAGSQEERALWREFMARHPVRKADVRAVVDHIDHVVGLVGVDHVGLGSDFDGVGDSLPAGLEDVSKYPNLIGEMLARGYHPADIEKICGENLLRVWSEVERLRSGTGKGP